MQKTTFATIAALLVAPTVCFAQSSTTTGVVGGAATGAIVGGPVGAVVGGVVGGTMGAALEPPPAEVRTYVRRERGPSVRMQEEIVVGEPLPPRVKLHTVPKHPKYRFAIINEQRVIVEPKSRRVVEIID
jgi:hypothetical protein